MVYVFLGKIKKCAQQQPAPQPARATYIYIILLSYQSNQYMPKCSEALGLRSGFAGKVLARSEGGWLD